MDIHLFFNYYIEELRDLESFVELTSVGFEYTKNVDLEVFNQLSATSINSISKINPVTNYKRNLTNAKSFAKEQEENGFPFLYNLVTIRTYGILEAAIDDYVVNYINQCENLNNFEYIRKFEGTLVDFINMSKLEQAHHLVSISKNKMGTNLKLGIGKFESLLKIIDLGGELEEEISKQILELSQIRNVLVHKNGFADSKFIEICPWLNLKIGDAIKTNHQSFIRYNRVVVYYLLKILERNQLKTEKSESNLIQLKKMYETQFSVIRLNGRMINTK